MDDGVAGGEHRAAVLVRGPDVERDRTAADRRDREAENRNVSQPHRSEEVDGESETAGTPRFSSICRWRKLAPGPSSNQSSTVQFTISTSRGKKAMPAGSHCPKRSL